MSERNPSMEQAYRTALANYLNSGEERFLEEAYEIGRRAVDERRGILDVVSIHQQAFSGIPGQDDGESRRSLAGAAFDFLREALAPFEMTQSGYVEALDRLKNINVELERQVNDRTVALTEEINERKRAETELRQALSRLQLSNEELQDFANAASHDLQEPLRKIRTFGDRLYRSLSDTVSGQNLDFLKRMQLASGRMQDLIDDLLMFSRVTNANELFVTYDMNVLVKNVLQDLDMLIEQNAATVEVGPMPTFACNPSQMRRLFQNLIVNAIKFHGKDSTPVVRISGSETQYDYEIRISDNGIGFDEKFLDRIFTPFQRLHGSEEYRGTGMGLAIVRRIAQQHNGNITAVSKPTQSEGSTFVVTIPKKGI